MALMEVFWVQKYSCTRVNRAMGCATSEYKRHGWGRHRRTRQPEPLIGKRRGGLLVAYLTCTSGLGKGAMRYLATDTVSTH